MVYKGMSLMWVFAVPNNFICGENTMRQWQPEDTLNNERKNPGKYARQKNWFGQSPGIEVTCRNTISSRKYLSPPHLPLDQKRLSLFLELLSYYYYEICTRNGRHLFRIQGHKQYTSVITWTNDMYNQSINQLDLYEIKGEREGGGCFYPTQVIGGDWG